MLADNDITPNNILNYIVNYIGRSIFMPSYYGHNVVLQTGIPILTDYNGNAVVQP